MKHQRALNERLTSQILKMENHEEVLAEKVGNEWTKCGVQKAKATLFWFFGGRKSFTCGFDEKQVYKKYGKR